MNKTAAFEAGVESSMVKMALSPKTVMEAFGKRSIQAFRKGGGKMRYSGIPVPSTIKGSRAQMEFSKSPKGELYERGLGRALKAHGGTAGDSIMSAMKGAIKETVKR